MNDKLSVLDWVIFTLLILMALIGFAGYCLTESLSDRSWACRLFAFFILLNLVSFGTALFCFGWDPTFMLKTAPCCEGLIAPFTWVLAFLVSDNSDKLFER